MKEQEAAVLAAICVRRKEEEGAEGVRSAARVEVRFETLEVDEMKAWWCLARQGKRKREVQ